MKYEPATDRFQFSLKSMLALTTLWGLVFAVLSLLGTSPGQALIGFAVLGGIVGLTAVIVEAIATAAGMRGRF